MDTIKWTQNGIEVPEGKEKGAKRLFKEIMAKNFFYPGKQTSRSRKPREL